MTSEDKNTFVVEWLEFDYGTMVDPDIKRRRQVLVMNAIVFRLTEPDEEKAIRLVFQPEDDRTTYHTLKHMMAEHRSEGTC